MGTNDIDTTVNGWQSRALGSADVQDAIKSGVYTALVGSGWRADADTVADCIGHINVLLLDGYLDKWAGYTGKNKNMLTGFCRWVAYQKTVNFVKLHVHRYDGSVDAMRIDATDATADDKAPRTIADDHSALAFVRVEQRERLMLALEALEALERSHIDALLAGESSADWAARNDMTPVQAARHKAATVAKLATLVQE